MTDELPAAECTCCHWVATSPDDSVTAYAGAAHEASNPRHEVEIVPASDRARRSMTATYEPEAVMRWLNDPQREVERQCQLQQERREGYAARYGVGARARR